MMGGDDDTADQLATTSTPNENSEPNVNGVPPVDDPWDTPHHTDDAHTDGTDELDGPNTKTVTNDNNPLMRLRQSSARLGQSLLTSATNLDNRFHVSQTTRNLDSKYNVSESVSNSTRAIATALGSLKITERVSSVTSKVTEDAPNLDEIASKTRGIISALDDAVARPVSIKVREEVAPVVSRKCEDWGVNDSLRVAGQKVRELDERVGVSRTAVEVGSGTVDVLAEGMDKMAQRLDEGGAGQGGNEAEVEEVLKDYDLSMGEDKMQGGEEEDKDGFPSSFTKAEVEDDDDI